MASEGQATWIYGAGFAAGSLAEVGGKDKLRELKININTDMKLMEVRTDGM